MDSFFLTLISGLRRLTSRFQRSLVPRSMNRKVRYIALLNEVTIARNGDCARIEYKEEGIAVTQLHIGPEIAEMSDRKIIELHNECLRDDARLANKYKHVAVEVPLGSSQIEYVDRCDQWVPRGGVLRCLIQDDENGRLTVKIDEQELRLKQFGKLLTTYAGWGMRIEFVPEDEVHRRPVLEVREPTPEDG
jgi:hypothetical protein